MTVKINFLFMLMLIMPNLSFSQDEYDGEEGGGDTEVVPDLCTSTLSASDFIKKNNDVFTATISNFNWLTIQNSYKGSYSANYVIREIEEGQWSTSKFKDQIKNYYWGLEKNNYQKPISLNTQNCFPKSKEDEFKDALGKYLIESKSPVFIQTKKYNFEQVKKLIGEKKFYLKNKKPDWESFEQVADMSEELAIRMLNEGFPIEDKKESESTLFTAVLNSYPSLTKEILKRKADPNLKSKYSKVTPLTFAIVLGDAGIVEALLKAGAKAESQQLCFLTGHPDWGRYTYRDVSDDRIKIAKMLIAKNLDFKVPCRDGVLSDNAFTMLAHQSHLPLFKLVLDSGQKLSPQWHYDDGLLMTIWEKHPEINSSLKQKYEQFKKDLESKDPLKEQDLFGRALSESVNYGDFDFYKKIIDRLKPNLQFQFKTGTDGSGYKRCSSDVLIRSTDNRYLEYALKNGLKPQYDCDGQGSSGNMSFAYELAKSCQLEKLKLLNDVDVAKINVEEKELDQFISYSGSSTFFCLETLKYLKSKGNGIRDFLVLKKFIQSNAKKAIDSVLESSLISNSAVEEMKLYLAKSDEPVREDINPENRMSISEDTKNYFYSKVPSAKYRIKRSASQLNLTYIIGEHYPLCAIDEQLIASGQLRTNLRTCKQLTPETITYFEIKEIKENTMKVIAISPIKEWYFGAGIMFGQSLILDQNLITSAEYLKTPAKNYPVTRLGRTAISLEQDLKVVGKYDVCESAKDPSLPKDSILVKEHTIDVKNDCLNNLAED